MESPPLAATKRVPSGWARFRERWWPDPEAARTLFGQLVFSRLALVIVGWVALALLPWQYVSPTYNVSTNPLILMWTRWDALWYIDIANHGYWFQALAFFPLYPLLTAALKAITFLPADITALVVSNLALIGTTVAFWGLLREYYPRALAERTVTWLLLFPTGYYLSAAYTESLFMFTTLMAFWLARRQSLWWAGAFGILATLTRNQGVFTAIPIWYAYWALHPRSTEQRAGGPLYTWEGFRERISGWDWRHWQILAPAVPFLGIAAYMIWQGIVFHTPVGFIEAQAYWGRHITWPWVGAIAATQRILSGGPLQATTVLSMMDLFFGLGFIGLWIVGWRRRLPAPWLMYWGVLLLIDISAPDLYGQSPWLSMSRLVLVLFPGFVTLGMLSEHPLWNRAMQWLFPMLQAVFFVTFATWHWIA